MLHICIIPYHHVFATANNNNNKSFVVSYVSALLIISIMEVEFDTRLKHPWSMIVSGPSSSGKTVFTKEGMPSSLDAYLQLSGPKVMVFDDMIMQCASSELIAQAFTQKRHHQNISIILILQNLYCQGR